MGAADKGSTIPLKLPSLRDQLNAYIWMLVWICLSVSIILVNKHVIFYSGFHFPISLAFWHMFLATVTARLSVWALDLPDAISQANNTNLYMQVALTGLLFGGTLVAGNAALLFLSVPTIQMLKVGRPWQANMPVLLYSLHALWLGFVEPHPPGLPGGVYACCSKAPEHISSVQCLQLCCALCSSSNTGGSSSSNLLPGSTLALSPHAAGFQPGDGVRGQHHHGNRVTNVGTDPQGPHRVCRSGHCRLR